MASLLMTECSCTIMILKLCLLVSPTVLLLSAGMNGRLLLGVAAGLITVLRVCESSLPTGVGAASVLSAPILLPGEKHSNNLINSLISVERILSLRLQPARLLCKKKGKTVIMTPSMRRPGLGRVTAKLSFCM